MKDVDYKKELEIGLTKEHSDAVEYFNDLLLKYENNHFMITTIKKILLDLSNKEVEDFKEKYKNSLKIENSVEKIENLIEDQKFEEALELIDKILEQLKEEEKSYNFENERVFSLSDLFETSIVVEMYRNDFLPIITVETPFAYIYFLKGSILNSLSMYVQAKEVLEKARQWNPINTTIAYQYLETLFELGEYEEFYELNKWIFNLSYRYESIEQGYVNMAIYLIIKGDIKAAKGYIDLAKSYGSFYTDSNKREKYINQMYGISEENPTNHEMRKYSIKYGFPLRPNKKLGNFAYNIGLGFYNSKNYDLALYYLEIANSINDDVKISKLLDTILKMD